MTSKISHGSLFTGVGGIDLGFEKAGIETIWQCEINKRCRSVLAKRWPAATRYEDVCALDGASVTPVDIVTFGSPCQDLSIAGRRAGFTDGTRSNLYFEAVRIIKEMRDASQNEYPKIAVWENVRGALTSNGGKDFLAAVEALASIGALDISWRVLNSCHFGPPQRRVRVFLVADFRGRRTGAILSKRPRVLWHPPACSGSREETAGEAEEGSRGDDELVYKKIANSLSSSNHRIDYETETFVLQPQRTPYVKVIRPGVNPADGELTAEVWREEQVGPSLNQFDNLSDTRATVIVGEESAYRVRRLTPRECERLMGWPDDHTRWASDGKEVADTTRYRMCGNGVSAPVAQWIGENIVKALKR